MEHLKYLECTDYVVATVKKSHFAKTDVFAFQNFLIVPFNSKSAGCHSERSEESSGV